MHSQLIDATNRWFLWPSSPDKPSNDRLWVYITLVALMGETDRSGDYSRNVHRYFTYLLHGCNPVTAEKKISAFGYESITEDPIFTEDLLQIFSRLLDFSGNETNAPKFKLYMKFLDVAETFGSVVITDTIGEQRTLLLLAISLCTYLTNKHPNDLTSVQACLNLYHTHRKIDVGTPQVEYSNEIGLMYTVWLKENIDRLFRWGMDTTEELMSKIGYMAWFASLIKAKRMLTAFGDNREFAGQAVQKLLEDNVKMLFDFIDTYPLVAVDNESSSTCSRFLNVLGIKPKKKLKGI